MLSDFLDALSYIPVQSRYFADKRLSTQRVISQLVCHGNREQTRLVFETVNATNKTHGVVVLLHLFHFFRGKSQKLKYEARTSHFVSGPYDLHELLKLFPPSFVVALVFLGDGD